MPFDRAQVRLSEGEVHYYIAGSGKPVLCFHSAGGVRMTPAVELLAKSFKIYMPIFPGFDDTPRLEGVRRMPDLARLGAEFGEKVIKEPYDLAGHSFGGWVATWLATLYPEKIELLVLQCPAGFRPEGIGGLGGDPAALQRKMYAHPEKLPPETKSAATIAANREAAGNYNLGIATDQELVSKLPDIRSLTLILHGTKDGVIPLESPRLLKGKIRRSNLLYIHDAAHNIEVDQPERYAEVVKDFLTRGEVFIVNPGKGAAASA